MPIPHHILLFFRLNPILCKWDCINDPGYSTPQDFPTFDLVPVAKCDFRFEEEVMSFLAKRPG